MLRDYTVHYSEEDLEDLQPLNLYYSMESNLNPQCGEYVVKRDGIYEITNVVDDRLFMNKWNVYIKPILTQCQVDDIICVQNKDKLYKCVSGQSYDQQYFRKVTLLSVMTSISDLSDKLREFENLLCSIVIKDDD